MRPLKIYVLEIRQTGAKIVYDERFPGPDKDTISAFDLRLNWARDFVKNHLAGKVCRYSNPREVAAYIKKYNDWLLTDKGKDYQSEAESWRSERIAEAVRLHERKFHSERKQQPKIIMESTRKTRHTHCYSCRSHLDSSITPECTECGWIICECGSCGCQYTKM